MPVSYAKSRFLPRFKREVANLPEGVRHGSVISARLYHCHCEECDSCAARCAIERKRGSMP